MKVAFSTGLPFYLAHGGFQTMIEALENALMELDVAVCHDAWWLSRLDADIIHYFGRPPTINVRMAREKGYKVIFTDVLDSTASRSKHALCLQKMLISFLRKSLGSFAERFAWNAYHEIDAYVTIVPHELAVAQYLFGVDPSCCHTIPHGLKQSVLSELSKPVKLSDDYLLSLATIDPRKNTLKLARLAKTNRVPIIFAGKPYSEKSSYFKEFKKEIDGHYVKYAGFVSEEDKHRLLKKARGFVLLSNFESGCVAIYEAAAAGLPLLLSDKPWATLAYPASKRITYADINKPAVAGGVLTEFYKSSERYAGKQTFSVRDWSFVAKAYLDLYNKVLS